MQIQIQKQDLKDPQVRLEDFIVRFEDLSVGFEDFIVRFEDLSVVVAALTTPIFFSPSVVKLGSVFLDIYSQPLKGWNVTNLIKG